MKQIKIRKHFSHFKTNSEDIEAGSFDESLEKLDGELKAVLHKYGLEMVETETRFLPAQKLSVFHFEKYDHLWLTAILIPQNSTMVIYIMILHR